MYRLSSHSYQSRQRSLAAQCGYGVRPRCQEGWTKGGGHCDEQDRHGSRGQSDRIVRFDAIKERLVRGNRLCIPPQVAYQATDIGIVRAPGRCESHSFLRVVLALLFKPSTTPLEIIFWRPEVNEDQFPVPAKRSSDLLHGLDAGTHGLNGTTRRETSRPRGASCNP